MKKGLKTLMMCCLCIVMGIFIGSESKSLMKYIEYTKEVLETLGGIIWW